ncbi:hypothetical protein Tco_0927273 [Tanacetum coccineum]
MERATTTASSLEAEQDSGSGPKCQDTILGGAKAQIRFEAASKQSNDPPLLRVNTLGSGEDIMKLKELGIKLSDIIRWRYCEFLSLCLSLSVVHSLRLLVSCSLISFAISLPELFVTSHGGTMAMSLMHQWHDTICGGVIGPQRSLLEHMDAS